ncbi:MAG: BrnT family toxin [Pseudomonadales bacterium]
MIFMDEPDFEWDELKNRINQRKRGVTSEQAQYAFLDTLRVIARDMEHSGPHEARYYCFDKAGRGVAC